ncbi:MAG: YdcF family protein [Bacillota bacterium]
MGVKIRKLFDYGILIIGLLGILDFVFLMLINTVINFGILFPLVAGIILTITAILRLTGRGHLIRIRNTFIRRLFIACIIMFLASFILVEGAIIVSANTDKNVKVDCLIILGAGLKGDQITLTFKNRLDKGIEYLKENPDIKVIVTGGQGPGETITEAEAMEGYLVKNGINKDRIIKEDRATSTSENIKYSKEILQKLTGKSSYRIMIVTNDFHMFRSKMIARRNGFTAYGVPAETNIFVLVNCYIREYFAVIKTFLFDLR